MEFDYFNAIGSVGFPIVAYFMLQFKLGKSLDKNTDALTSLKTFLETKKL